ncbi:hypothetical protein EX30DRAFT_339585 [Ascodesmis nigricans]|uniref:Uncharacterized protein n=1 Tax=Ascodesmis nigricans TaxID=341454 RepID=A0A4S2N2W0_9PEZI|nr:hypothetical protein EX30DRAFT_339585 [Ascodesmis nigricans]
MDQTPTPTRRSGRTRKQVSYNENNNDGDLNEVDEELLEKMSESEGSEYQADTGKNGKGAAEGDKMELDDDDEENLAEGEEEEGEDAGKQTKSKNKQTPKKNKTTKQPASSNPKKTTTKTTKTKKPKNLNIMPMTSTNTNINTNSTANAQDTAKLTYELKFPESPDRIPQTGPNSPLPGDYEPPTTLLDSDVEIGSPKYNWDADGTVRQYGHCAGNKLHPKSHRSDWLGRYQADNPNERARIRVDRAVWEHSVDNQQLRMAMRALGLPVPVGEVGEKREREEMAEVKRERDAERIERIRKKREAEEGGKNPDEEEEKEEVDWDMMDDAENLEKYQKVQRKMLEGMVRAARNELKLAQTWKVAEDEKVQVRGLREMKMCTRCDECVVYASDSDEAGRPGDVLVDDDDGVLLDDEGTAQEEEIELGLKDVYDVGEVKAKGKDQYVNNDADNGTHVDVDGDVAMED